MRASFRITANQVTFARLLAIPFLCAALYGGTAWRLLSLFLGIAVGFTDLLDGYLARKYGPTVLGGLMDPLADKVFVAASLLALADLGWAPWWLVYAVLVREFLVTALRSSFEKRRRTLKTTYLAKVKTWVQMFVLAVVVGLVMIPLRAMTIAFVSIAIAAVLAAAVTQLMGRRWRGIWIFAGFFAVGSTLHVLAGKDALLLGLYVVVAAITWGSALDYLSVAVKELAGARDFHLFDTWRVLGALLVPTLATLVLQLRPVAPWAVIALVIAEIFHGGLDNLLAHHDSAAGPRPWAARTLGVSALLGAALVWPEAADYLLLAALAGSAAATTLAFVQNRRFYLEEKLREKPVGARV